MQFIVPKSVTSGNFASLVDKFRRWKNAVPDGTKKVVFDFSGTTYIEPIAIVFFAAEEDFFVSKGCIVEYKVEVMSKVAAFLQNFGLYVTRRKEELEDLYKKAMAEHTFPVRRVREGKEGAKAVKSLVDALAKRIKCSDTARASANWTFYELIDNAGTHGYRSYGSHVYLGTVYVCAFSYKDRLSAVVYDRGIGIAQSLQNKYPELTGKQAFSVSIEQGKSGSPEGSAGFGLYGTSQIAKFGKGTVQIWSNGFVMDIKGAEVGVKQAYDISGTMVHLSISASSAIPFEAIVSSNALDYLEDLEGLEF